MPNLHAHCLDPTSTIAYVESCPDSKSSWDRAAKRKGCHQISNKCVDLPKQDLEYHCLINPYINETVEVCASSRRIFGGYCPEYSILAGGVQENFDIDCKKFKSPCPTFFMSTDAYKYQECYKMMNRQTAQSALESSTKTYSERSHPTNTAEPEAKYDISVYGMPIILGMGVVLVFILLFIGTLLYCRRKRKQRFNGKNEDVKMGNDVERTEIVNNGTDNCNHSTNIPFLADSNNHVYKHHDHRTDKKKPYATTADGGKQLRNGNLNAQNKSITNNGTATERLSDG